MTKNKRVLVIGGGVAGMESAISCARLGYEVFLLDRASSIGGHMAQLDKTFPTNDCSMCILSPRMHDVKREKRINLLTNSQVASVSGQPGNFTVVITRLPRYVDEAMCIGCGTCTTKCPVKVGNPFNMELDQTKAIHQLFPQSVPAVPVINVDNCLYFRKGKCRICEKLCPVKAVRFDQEPAIETLKVGAIILATGFETFNPTNIPEYSYNPQKNVVSSLDFERILSPTGPTQGELVRLSDKSPPKRIAFIQCVGSRDPSRGRPYCSEVCCLITFKQAMLALAREGVEEVSIFYIDRRAQEKEGEEYLRRLQSDERAKFIRGKVAQVVPKPDGSLELHYGDRESGFNISSADMVVLAVGLGPQGDSVAEVLGIENDPHGFVLPDTLPGLTSSEGIFACGGIVGPQSIPSSVLQAEAAAQEVGRLLYDSVSCEEPIKKRTEEKNDVREIRSLKTPSEERLGIFVCRCGTNIAGVIDTKEVAEYAKNLPHVVWAQENLFSCSSDATREMANLIKKKGITRLLVASCTPRTHLPIFRDVMMQAGLNPGFVTMANIREQCAWVHKKEPDKAKEKAKKLINAAAGRLTFSRPLPFLSAPVVKRVVIIGGGISGLTAAKCMCDQGIEVVLVEKTGAIGGRAFSVTVSPDGVDVLQYIERLSGELSQNPKVHIYLGAALKNFTGTAGNFKSTIITEDGEEKEIIHGALVVAIGAGLLKPMGLFGYGEIEGVITQRELAYLINNRDAVKKESSKHDMQLEKMRHLCMIQCVGSRTEERPYCSRICCSTAVSHALKLKELYPVLQISILYRDIRTYGLFELLYQEAREKGINFIPYKSTALPRVSGIRLGKRKAVKVEVETYSTHGPEDRIGSIKRSNVETLCLTVDCVVLSEATIPTSDHEKLSQILKLPLSGSGFFMEKHLKLGPAETQIEGVFVCGQAHYPKMVAESINQAKAVSARALSLLFEDVRERFASTVSIDPGRCIRCLTCVRVCPYGVPVFAEGRVFIDKLKCQGCGICAAECPGKAIEPDVMADSQTLCELELLAR